MEHSPVILAAQGRAAFQPKGLIAPLFSGFRLIPGINAGAIHIEPRWGYRSQTRGVLKIEYCFLSVDYFALLNLSSQRTVLYSLLMIWSFTWLRIVFAIWIARSISSLSGIKYFGPGYLSVW